MWSQFGELEQTPRLRSLPTVMGTGLWMAIWGRHEFVDACHTSGDSSSHEDKTKATCESQDRLSFIAELPLPLNHQIALILSQTLPEWNSTCIWMRERVFFRCKGLFSKTLSMQLVRCCLWDGILSHIVHCAYRRQRHFETVLINKKIQSFTQLRGQLYKCGIRFPSATRCLSSLFTNYSRSVFYNHQTKLEESHNESSIKSFIFIWRSQDRIFYWVRVLGKKLQFARTYCIWKLSCKLMWEVSQPPRFRQRLLAADVLTPSLPKLKYIISSSPCIHSVT